MTDYESTAQDGTPPRSLVEGRDRWQDDDGSPEAVLALDNIALDLPVAGAGSRALAVTLDYLILGIVLPIVIFGLSILLSRVVPDSWFLVGMIFLVFFVQWFAFLTQELLLKGRTLGKIAVHLRVVGRSGGAATVGQILTRNLIRPVDIFVGMPLIALDPLGRRLGDRAAGTLVVHDRQEKAALTLGRIPQGWGAREVSVAESLLRRQKELDPDQLRHLALRLVKMVERDDPPLLEGFPEPENNPMAALRHALGVQEAA